MSSIVVLSIAQPQVDVDKLFHANPPSLSPNSPVQRPQSNQNTDNGAIGGNFDGNENFRIFRGPRHDEFDWGLTKVNLHIYISQTSSAIQN